MQAVKYSQFKGMMAITKASFRSMMRSPSTIIFTFLFPFIFIIVFGFIGNGGAAPVYRVVIDPNSDTSNLLYKSIKSIPRFNIVAYADPAKKLNDIRKGRIAGEVLILKSTTSNPAYTVKLKSSNASSDEWPQVKEILEGITAKLNAVTNPPQNAYAAVDFNAATDVQKVREYKTIDFILPGQLGFSLLSAGVFGVAFMFFNLRNTLVLKRFYATPISRLHIIIGEALSRVLFQMITAVVIIGAGYLFFGFTLVHGLTTLAEMLFLSFLGLLVFMGFGLIISSLAKTDSSIAPFANLITLPQFLLAGTFFSIAAFPKWLQPISKVLPLTHLNNAMRSVAFEGLNLWDVRFEIGVLLLWGIVVYAVATKVFRWE